MISTVCPHLSVRACFTRRLIRILRAHPRPALAAAQLYNRKLSPVHAPLAFKPSELSDGSFGLSQEQSTTRPNGLYLPALQMTLCLHFMLFVTSQPIPIIV